MTAVPDERVAVRDAVAEYAGSELFAAAGPDNPYRRPLGPTSMVDRDFSVPPGPDDVLGAGALAAHRMLLNIYEADLVFLPGGDLGACWDDFRAFYSPENRARGEWVRPVLERYAFGFLDRAVEVTGGWGAEELRAYLLDLQEQDLTAPTPALRAVADSADPARAARMYLAQLAPDFLSEASPMIRNLLGNYGPALSEWFKIVIDEYGYGVHDAKHSTLFENTLRTAGLGTGIHDHWDQYLPGSLLVNNYFHFLGKNHENLFRYLGALYYTETALVEFCRNAAELFGSVFDGAVDVEYFTEHVHIDTHHGRMALENLILPLVADVGPVVIPDIVRGFEEYQAVAEMADRDFAEQVRFMDGLAGLVTTADTYTDTETDTGETIVLTGSQALTSRSHDVDVRYRVESGALRLVAGYGAEQLVRADEQVRVPRHRLHGAVAEGGPCTVRAEPVVPGCSS